MSNQHLLKAKEVTKHFPIRSGLFQTIKGHVRAVDGVSFQIEKGATLGLVGESGCGKTTLGRCLLRLTEPTRGEIVFRGIDLASLPSRKMREMRKDLQMVFQDPNSSLDPRMNVHDIVAEPLNYHLEMEHDELQDKIIDLLRVVGLKEEHLWKYPHELSGGQSQRVAIARAISLNPDFIVLDEPTSALDVSVQSQILNLLLDLQKDFDLTYMFISHDLSVINYVSDISAVMYLGDIVEIGSTEECYSNPHHPYTSILYKSLPEPEPGSWEYDPNIKGEPGSPEDPPSGCKFHPRCPNRQSRCSEERPLLREIKDGHQVRCFYPI